MTKESESAVRRPRSISAKKTKSLIRAAVKPELLPVDLELEAFKGGGSDLVRKLPGWIGGFGVLKDGGEILFWGESKPEPGETFPGQFAIDVPPGRWMVEIYDPVAAAWISRESAEGGPLVAGLPFTGHPLLVRIRPFPLS